MFLRLFKSLSICVAAGLCALSAPATAQGAPELQIGRGYPLGPGDVLRLDFLARPEVGRDIPVELNGYADFPFAGAVHVAGRSIAELRAELPVILTGAVLRERVGDSVQVVPVTEEEVVLAVKSYRPVIVAGDVRQPGEVDFSVGMTARMAVFKALGVGAALAAGGSASAQDLYRRRAELIDVIVERAVLTALLQERQVLTAEDLDLSAGVAMAPAAVLERASTDLLIERSLLAEQKARDAMRIEAAQEEVMIALSRTEELMRGVQVEKKNVERLEGLASRFAAYSNALVQGRRTQLQAAQYTRNARDDVDEAMLKRRELVASQKIESLKREQGWRTRLAALDAKFEELRATATPMVSDGPGAASVTLYRQGPSGVASKSVPMDHLLMPGDLIEVHLAEIGQ